MAGLERGAEGAGRRETADALRSLGPSFFSRPEPRNAGLPTAGQCDTPGLAAGPVISPSRKPYNTRSGPSPAALLRRLPSHAMPTEVEETSTGRSPKWEAGKPE